MGGNVGSRYGLSRQLNAILRMGRKGHVMESHNERLYLIACRADTTLKGD